MFFELRCTESMKDKIEENESIYHYYSALSIRGAASTTVRMRGGGGERACLVYIETGF